MNKTYDVIIIGAGSIGMPSALFLAEAGQKVLVIDSEHAPGQQNNKKAIGGIRATHSDYGKIQLCQRSIELLKNWKEERGDEIGWLSNGYSYPAWEQKDKDFLLDLMKVQHSFGLNIRWVDSKEYEELVPGINTDGLLGSTYSPEDGSCSPLLVNSSIYFHALKAGVDFRFGEKVTELTLQNDRIVSCKTNKGEYTANIYVNAAGNHAREIGALVHSEIQVFPDNHEAGITEPVARFFGPMIVDMRARPGSANFYFYQNHEGQVVFCYTPEPAILGVDNLSTSQFLPHCSKRLLEVYPRLKFLKVRRTWRGQYPMTPDGFPIIGFKKECSNLLHVVGMCGQGFMMGPATGELVSRICTANLSDKDHQILKSFDPYRDFSGVEAFK